MTHLLDTSAIIGWLERRNSSLPAMLGASDTALYHPVTLGELHAGGERADGEAERDMRRNTLAFAAQRLEAVEGHVLAYEQFGFLTARFSRKLSHNDYWIVAAAVASPGLELVTEDQKLFGVVTSGALALAVSERGWKPPTCHLAESTPIQPTT